MINLSPTESEIMEVLWESEGMTNSELIAHFRKQGKEWKRQTTNTFFTRLIQKGLVSRAGHKYIADCTREEFGRRQAKEVLNTMYGGSLKNFITALNACEELSEEEDRKLNELINYMEQEFT